MPAGVILLLVVAVTLPGALLLAYLHARVLGWDPRDE